MLFSISLAQKLGSRGLQSYSVHPGLILSTGLGTHLDFASMDADLGTFSRSTLTPFNTLTNKTQSNLTVNVATLKDGQLPPLFLSKSVLRHMHSLLSTPTSKVRYYLQMSMNKG